MTDNEKIKTTFSPGKKRSFVIEDRCYVTRRKINDEAQTFEHLFRDSSPLNRRDRRRISRSVNEELQCLFTEEKIFGQLNRFQRWWKWDRSKKSWSTPSARLRTNLQVKYRTVDLFFSLIKIEDRIFDRINEWNGRVLLKNHRLMSSMAG